MISFAKTDLEALYRSPQVHRFPRSLQPVRQEHFPGGTVITQMTDLSVTDRTADTIVGLLFCSAVLREASGCSESAIRKVLAMSHSRNLICGGLSLLLVSSAGCAGKGLRNMFSRNETAGYSTLEDLEASEQGSAEETSAVVDADEAESTGPRFASWVPFTGTHEHEEDVDDMATSDVSAKEGKAVTNGRWWQHPFRKNGPAKTDPFLMEESVPESLIAGIEEPAARTGVKPPDGKPVRTVSEKPAPVGGTPEDRLLVDKFEEHFKQNTADTVNSVEQAEPLIVAGKKTSSPGTAETPSVREAAAEDKLADLERILTARKSPATRRHQRPSERAQIEAAELQQVSAGYDHAVESVHRSARQNSREGHGTASQAVHSFDNLLGAPTEKVATAAGRTTRKPETRSPQISQISVAEAESLFGESVRGAVRRGKTAQAQKSEDGNNSRRSMISGNGEGFRWAQSPLETIEAQGTGRAKHSMQSTMDQFAEMFHTRHAVDVVPPAVLRDPPESAFQPVDPSMANRHSASITMAASRAIRQASVARELPSGNSPASLSEDSFFSDEGATNPSAPTSSTPASGVSSSEESRVVAATGSAISLTSRNWLLLIGGIIVVALLFAPGRRKPVSENHSPVQG